MGGVFTFVTTAVVSPFAVIGGIASVMIGGEPEDGMGLLMPLVSAAGEFGDKHGKKILSYGLRGIADALGTDAGEIISPHDK